MPLLAQVGHGKDPALDIVDADTAEVGPATAVDEHDGDAAPRQHVERRRVLVNRRDEDAAHPLLQEQFEVVALA